MLETAVVIGYVPDETGALVDWALLGDRWLSTTKLAAVGNSLGLHHR